MAVVEQEQVFDPNSPQDEGEETWIQDLTDPEKQQLQSEGNLDKEGKLVKPVSENHPTKLGRKVKELAERFTPLEEKLSRLLTMNQELLTKTQETRRPVQQEDEDEVPEHVKEVLPYVKRELSKEQEEMDRKNKDYFDKYVGDVKTRREDTDEALHKAVVDELLESNYRSYKKISGDPAYDAQVNYDLAVANILKRERKGQGKRANVHGDQEHAPLGLSSSSANALNPQKKIEPDEFAAKFLRAIGAKGDDAWVQESLKGAK